MNFSASSFARTLETIDGTFLKKLWGTAYDWLEKFEVIQEKISRNKQIQNFLKNWKITITGRNSVVKNTVLADYAHFKNYHGISEKITMLLMYIPPAFLVHLNL